LISLPFALNRNKLIVFANDYFGIRLTFKKDINGHVGRA